ncbi:MAG TPA: DinB family protein [Candidatus Paceibacterota bacterium]|jgi:uncharacterized damage-inducible protein DinB|nr:DinB family protein [Candidatus Paceibacterota bacterium]
MIKKDDLLQLFRKECATTLRVMRAYPHTQMHFAPHERSQQAKRLMATFVFEMYLMRSYILGETVDRSVFQTYEKETLDELIADFEHETKQVIEKIEALRDEDFTKSVEFAGKQFSADAFALMMLCDQIHHRGQLSVYVRMAGGKVPSIYGPSADDPTTNL